MGDLFVDYEDFIAEFLRACDNEGLKEVEDVFDPDSFDNYLNIELSVRRKGDHPEFSKVAERFNYHRGNPIGTPNDNPMTYSIMHEVEYYDGSNQSLSSNAVTENTFSNVDEGHRHLLLDSIIDITASSSSVGKNIHLLNHLMVLMVARCTENTKD